MKTAVLFIISMFVFSACVPKASVREFEDFVEAYKKVHAKNNAQAMDHLKLTRENMEEISALKKELRQMQTHLGIAISQLSQLDQTTVRWLVVILKALEYKGIKLDLKKTWDRMQQEEVGKKLKEKSK